MCVAVLVVYAYMRDTTWTMPTLNSQCHGAGNYLSGEGVERPANY